MRIVLTIHHPLDRNAGAASVVLRLGDEYKRLGHDVSILSHDDLASWIPRPLKMILFPWMLAAKLALSARHADVIDASSGDAWLLYALPRMGSRPLRVTHSHGLEHLGAEMELREAEKAGRAISFGKRLLRYGYRLFTVERSFKEAELALVLNEAETRYLVERQGMSPEKVARARLGVGDGCLASSAAHSPSSSFVISQIGSYKERKGIKHTAGAMTNIMRKRSDVSMLFLGTLVERDIVLKDFPSDLHDRVAVVSRYRNEDLPGLLGGVAINLMPSLFEGYGIAKIEAMACGVVPVVSDDGGAIADIYDGVNGLVVRRGETASLEQAIERLIADPALRANLRAAGLRAAAEASWPNVAAARLELYESHLRVGAMRRRRSSDDRIS